MSLNLTLEIGYSQPGKTWLTCKQKAWECNCHQLTTRGSSGFLFLGRTEREGDHYGEMVLGRELGVVSVVLGRERG
jgi:hypothetical protein